MVNRVKNIVQILFLGIFILLMGLGKAQFWMGFIFLSVILATFFGRFYCGWACPINTLIQPVVWLKKKLGVQDKKGAKFLKSSKLRWIIFGIFLVALGYTIYTITQGRKFPLPLIIIPLGLLTTFIISEKSWHRYLCPWGILFSMTSRYSKHGIKSKGCISCSICKADCPGDAIVVEKGKGAVIDMTYCLLCFKCQESCPTKAISYK